MPLFCDQRRELAVGHFLGHVEQEPTVAIFNAAKELAEAAQITRFFPRAAPRDVIRAFPLGKVRQFGRLFAIVKKLVEGDFHCPRQLFESLDRRDGMAVLDSRDITAKKPSALFNVALGKIFRFTKQSDTLSNYHKNIVTWTSDARKNFLIEVISGRDCPSSDSLDILT